MGLHRLKAFRVGVSVVFFTLIALLFLDFRNKGGLHRFPEENGG